MNLLSTLLNLNREKKRVNTNHTQTWGEDANWLNFDSAMAADIVTLYGMIVTPTTPAVYTVQSVQPTTGQTVISNGSTYLALNPTGVLATLTVQFPSAPVNGQLFNINSTQNISELTYTGGTVQFTSTPIPFGAGVVRYIYNSSQGQWLLN